MGSRGSIGCFGVIALMIVVSMIISLIVFLVGVAAVVAGLGAAGWLGYSAVTDLRRRSRLARGAEPLQITGDRARALAASSHLAAAETLATTLEQWRHLQVTRAIGTPLQNSYDRLEQRLQGDLGFHDLVLHAETAQARAILEPPVTAVDLTRQTIEMDTLTVSIREAIHRRARSR